MKFLFNKPYFLLSISAILWGGNSVAGRLASGEIPPFTLTFSRWVVAAIIGSIIAYPYLKKDLQEIKRKRLDIFILGGLGFGLFTSLLYLALNYTAAINASIEQAVIPVFTLFLSFLILKEKSTYVQILGVVVAFFGVIVIAGQGSLFAGNFASFNIGDIIMIAGVFSYSLFAVYLKKVEIKIELLSLYAAMTWAAVVVTFPLFLYEMIQGEKIIVTTSSVLTFMYSATLPTLLGQLCFIRGVSLIGPKKASIVLYTVPVYGVIFSIILLKEQVKLYNIIGAAIIIIGILLAEKARQTDKKAANKN